MGNDCSRNLQELGELHRERTVHSLNSVMEQISVVCPNKSKSEFYLKGKENKASVTAHSSLDQGQKLTLQPHDVTPK